MASSGEKGVYSASPHKYPIKQIQDPSEYLKNSTFTQNLNGHRFIYFLAEKLNNSEIKYNQRILMLTDNTYFGYASKFQLMPIPIMNHSNMYQMKKNVPLEDITFMNDPDPMILHVKYTAEDKTDRAWKLKFQTASICNTVLNILLKAQQERIEEMHTPKEYQITVRKVEDKNLEDTNRTPEPKIKSPFEQQDPQTQPSPKMQLPTDIKEPIPKEFVKISLLNIGLGNTEELNPETYKFTSKQQKQLQKNTHTKERLYNSMMSRPKQETAHCLGEDLKIHNYRHNYNFLKQGEEYLVLPAFKEQAGQLVRKIVDELCVFSARRVYKPFQANDESWKYNVGGLSVEIGLCTSTMNKESRTRKYNTQGIQRLEEEFKNLDYLLQKTRNKGCLRVPLACLIDYKGFVALVKGDVPERPLSCDIGRELEMLSRECRMTTSTFDDPHSIEIVELSPKHFQQFSREEEEGVSNHFFKSLEKIFYFKSVRHLLPKDIRYINQDLTNKVLRPEVIHKEEYSDKLFLGQDISRFRGVEVSDTNEMYNLNTLSIVSKDLLDIGKELADELQPLNGVPVSTVDVDDLFHQKGLNTRYMWVVYQSTSIPLIRKICHTYSLVKTLCVLIQCKLQELVREWIDLSPFKGTAQEQIRQSNHALIQTAVSFINSLIGQFQNSDTIKLISTHMVDAYGIKFNKSEVLPGFLVQGINDNSRLWVKWPQERPKAYVFKETVLTMESIQKIDCNIRSYDLSYTALCQEVQNIISLKESNDVERLESILGLRLNGIPEHLKATKLYSPLLEYLSIYVRPLGLNSSARLPPSSSVYTLAQQLWDQHTVQVRISEIKWMLMDSTEDKTFKLINKFVSTVRRRSEENHPLEGEIYRMLSEYYLEKGECKEAEKFARDSLSVWANIVGQHHVKIGEAYYQIAEVHDRAANFNEALKNYRLSAQVLELKKDTMRSNEYGELLIKTSRLQLKLGRHDEAIETSRKAVKLYEENLDEDYEHERIESYDILSRAYEITRQDKEALKVARYCSEIIPQVEDRDNFIKTLKVVVSPLFLSMEKSSARKMLVMIQEVVEKRLVTGEEGLEYLRELVSRQNLFETLETYLHNFQEMHVYMSENNVVRRWSGLGNLSDNDLTEFVNLVASLSAATTTQFMLGIFSQTTIVSSGRRG